MPPTICLNMIVKDEAGVIRRCLESVKPFVDYWVIVDTGSGDGTQDLIRAIMADVPGELHERPWKNFGHNRTEALALARKKADYTFVVDADEVLLTPSGFRWPDLAADGYRLQLRLGTTTYWRTLLVSNRLPWRYEGVLHEYLTCDTRQPRQENLAGPTILSLSDGRRNQTDPTEKYAKDAHLLEQALKEEPNNARYVFYLAQSYRDSGQREKSLEAYRRRVDMGGWVEEVWYSLYEIARLSEHLQREPGCVMERYLEAYQYRPQRAESLCQLARYCRLRGKYAVARLFAKQAVGIPKPADILFIDEACYDWLCLDEYAVASYWTGDYRESEMACLNLLNGRCLPAEERPRVIENMNFARKAQGLPVEDWNRK
jgi:glycosyltransferase involved in cell wall biosynthesis